MIRAVLFDLDGVLYNGEEPIPGAADAVEQVRRSGVASQFVTNTTSRPRSALVTKLAKFGVKVALDDILTPPVAAAAWIRSRADGTAALFVPEGTRAEFVGLEATDNQEAVRYVVIGDLGRAWDYQRLNAAFRLLHGHPERRLIALGLTRFWQSSDGANLDVAPFVAALECATGCTAVVMGKPSKEFFLQAASRLDVAPEELLMIGDDLRVDVLGAQRTGLRSALVRTGKFRPSDLDGDVCPDWVLDSVCDLPALLSNGDH